MKMEIEEKPNRIKPEDVARKLAAIRDHKNLKALKQLDERPRLVELLWFVQAVSLRPGGLVKFCEDLIDANPAQVGTKTMRLAKGRNYSAVQKLEICREMDDRIYVEGLERISEWKREEMRQEEIDAIECKNDAIRLKALKEMGWEDFTDLCRKGALST